MRIANMWRRILGFAGVLGLVGWGTWALSGARVQAGPPAAMENRMSIPLVVDNTRLPATNFGAQLSRLTQAGGFDELAALQPGFIRFEAFHWDRIEPTRTSPPTYIWNQVPEAELRHAAEAGIPLVAIVLYAPEWALQHPGVACGPLNPAGVAAFAEFMQAAVARYSPLPYALKYWELGNEPDVDYRSVGPHEGLGCWGDRDQPFFGGGAYAAMLQQVYPVIEAADPEAQVLVGGLLLDCDPVHPVEFPPGSGRYLDCTPSTFIEGILAAGGGDFFDGIAFHNYDYYYPSMHLYGNINWISGYNRSGLEPVQEAKVAYLRGLLETYGHPDKYLMSTETALLCGNTGEEPECLDPAFEITKAYYVVAAHAAALALDLRANLWYSFVAGWRRSGLVEADLTPRPAYYALAFARSRLSGVTALGEVIPEDVGAMQVKGFKFVRGPRTIWVVWSLDGTPRNVQFSEVPVAVYDAFGNELLISTSQVVDHMPRYFEFSRRQLVQEVNNEYNH